MYWPFLVAKCRINIHLATMKEGKWGSRRGKKWQTARQGPIPRWMGCFSG